MISDTGDKRLTSKIKTQITWFVSVIAYCIRYFVTKSHVLIPHPRLRPIVFKWFGSKIGRRVLIEDLEIKNRAGWGFQNLELGDYSALVHSAKLDLSDRIIIGAKTCVAGTIYTHQDCGSMLYDSITVRRFPRKVAPVILGDNVYVAAYAVILCGVKVGNNSVIATGSVVTRDVPPNTLVGGVPARVIREFADDE